MSDPAPSTPLPPETPGERPDISQAVLTITVVIVVLVWPDLIPVVSVILALLGLHRRAH